MINYQYMMNFLWNVFLNHTLRFLTPNGENSLRVNLIAAVIKITNLYRVFLFISLCLPRRISVAMVRKQLVSAGETASFSVFIDCKIRKNVQFTESNWSHSYCKHWSYVSCILRTTYHSTLDGCDLLRRGLQITCISFHCQNYPCCPLTLWVRLRSSSTFILVYILVYPVVII